MLWSIGSKPSTRFKTSVGSRPVCIRNMSTIPTIPQHVSCHALFAVAGARKTARRVLASRRTKTKFTQLSMVSFSCISWGRRQAVTPSHCSLGLSQASTRPCEGPKPNGWDVEVLGRIDGFGVHKGAKEPWRSLHARRRHMRGVKQKILSSLERPGRGRTKDNLEPSLVQ